MAYKTSPTPPPHSQVGEQMATFTLICDVSSEDKLHLSYDSKGTFSGTVLVDGGIGPQGRERSVLLCEEDARKLATWLLTQLHGVGA